MSGHSHSSRQEFLTCKRKWYLNRVERIEPIRDATALRMGKAFALCLEEGFAGAADPEYDRALAECKDAVAATRMLTEQAQIHVLVDAYLARYGEPSREIEREHAFIHPLLGEGRIDAVHRLPTGIKGIEDKLLSKAFWREPNIRLLAADAQTTAYFAAMRELGTPMATMERRVTFKPSIKPDSRKSETIEQYKDRLAQRIQDDPEYAFASYTLARSDKDIDAFLERVNEIGEEIKYAKRRFKKVGVKAFTQNLGESCVQFGECAFLSKCVNAMGHESMYRSKPPRPKLNIKQQAVLRTLSLSFTEGAWVPDIAKQVALPDTQTRTALNALEKHGLVERNKIGRSVVFRVTDAGQEYLR